MSVDGKPKKRTRNVFTSQEDQQLRELVSRHGEKSWSAVAHELPGRCCRQCRERWFNYLSPTITNGPWTREETALLFQKVAELGTSWKVMQVHFPGRTEINIRNHFRQVQMSTPTPPPQSEPEREPPLPGFDDLVRKLVNESQNGFAQDDTNLFSFQVLF
jgi:hypothetical protein